MTIVGKQRTMPQLASGEVPSVRRARVIALRVILIGVLAISLWTSAQAKADPAVEYLQVPSQSMGRDIPVAFIAGGPRAVFLLDAFNAGPDVSNWVTAGNAFNTLAGRGISVAAPAGGGYSMYTNWEQDPSRQWQTFLGDELPNWLAANRGLAPGGHAIVGAAQGGSGALEAAAFRPDRFQYAGAMSAYVAPERTGVDGAITAGLQQYGGVDTRNMWGLPQLGRWKNHSPNVHAGQLAANGTRLWIFSPQTTTASDPAAVIGYPAIAQGTNRTFYVQYLGLGGVAGHFDFPVDGDHGWSSWGPQLSAMAPDLVAAIK